MKLRRKISQYQGGDPAKMSVMSQGAIFYALDDAKHDILALHAVNAQLLAACEMAERYFANKAKQSGHECMEAAALRAAISRAGGAK